MADFVPLQRFTNKLTNMNIAPATELIPHQLGAAHVPHRVDQQVPHRNGAAQAVKGDLLKAVPQEAVWLANFVSPQTKRTYRNAVKEFISFHQITSSAELRTIDQAHIIAWRDALIQNNASAKTINCRISAISSLFKHLAEKQQVQINPTIGVKRPRSNSDQVKTPVITAEQVRHMLAAPDLNTLKGCRDSVVLHILFYTGCRIAEVGSLKVQDYYEDAGYFVLDFQVKGGKRNKLAIHQECQLALRRYLGQVEHAQEREAPLILGVQRSQLRKALNVRQLSKIFQQYAQAVGLPRGVTPHSARATFITQALEKKCPIEAVQRSVGHAKISTTQMYDKRLLKHRESASFAVVY